MIHWFFDLLYGVQPAQFESVFDLQESIKRLSAATNRSLFSGLTHQAAVGTVSEYRVSLQRMIPFVGNSFKPFFIGEFRIENGRTILSGRFTMLWLVKAFMSFGFGFCLLWTTLAMKPLLQGDANAWWLPFPGVGMFMAGAVFVWICKGASRNDVAWLSRKIESALSNGQELPVYRAHRFTSDR
jgi:hypothetical protein